MIPNGSYEVVENGYWNDWVNGQMATHTFKHKFIFELSDGTEEWEIKATYPYAVKPFTWSQTDLVPAEGESEDITIIGKRGVVAGQKLEQEVQLTVDINVGEYDKEAFFPIEVSVCLPEGVSVPVNPNEAEEETDNETEDETEDETEEESEDETEESEADLTPKEGFTCNEIDIDSAVTETGAWQDGWANGKPTYHVFKHKFNIPLSETVESWYMQVSYPHPLFKIDTWGNYETEGNANDWTIISNPAWTYSDKLELEYQVNAEVEKTTDSYQKEDFFPTMAQLCTSNEVTIDEVTDDNEGKAPTSV